MSEEKEIRNQESQEAAGNAPAEASSQLAENELAAVTGGDQPKPQPTETLSLNFTKIEYKYTQTE